MCCSKRNFIYLFCGLMLALNIQMLQAKLGNKIIFIPEDDLKKHGFDVPDGRFGYDCMAESDNLVIFWERSFYTHVSLPRLVTTFMASRLSSLFLITSLETCNITFPLKYLRTVPLLFLFVA